MADPVTVATNLFGAVAGILVTVQHLAAGLKNIPAAWGKGQQTGSGSGWYKFWNAVASYPGNASQDAPSQPPK